MDQDPQKLLGHNQESLLLIQSEFSHLIEINRTLRNQLNSSIIGSKFAIPDHIDNDNGEGNVSRKPILDGALDDSSFMEMANPNESKVLNDQKNYEVSEEESESEFRRSVELQKPMLLQTSKISPGIDSDIDEGFNSREFSSDEEEEEGNSSISDNKNKETNDQVKDTIIDDELNKMTSKLSLLSKVGDDPFLDSSSPNQILNEEDKLKKLTPIEDSQFVLNPLNINKLSNSENDQAIQAIKELMVKSTELLNSEILLKENNNENELSTINENDEVAKKKLFEYNSNFNSKSNKLVNNLNNVIDQFT